MHSTFPIFEDFNDHFIIKNIFYFRGRCNQIDCQIQCRTWMGLLINLFNESGVDDAFLQRGERGKGDRCNALAAEFLVPVGLLHPAFDELGVDDAIKGP